jgi:hypothetical protein
VRPDRPPLGRLAQQAHVVDMWLWLHVAARCGRSLFRKLFGSALHASEKSQQQTSAILSQSSSEACVQQQADPANRRRGGRTPKPPMAMASHHTAEPPSASKSGFMR